jgi:high affinity Mn2+ porin
MPVSGQDAFRQWSIHFQATSIGDMHGSFPSPYEGENSLPAHFEGRVSLTATAFLATSAGRHVQFVIDPELAGGKGFGDVTGIAGFPNGEIPRVAGATPKPYLARGYVKVTWGIGDESEKVADGPNQLGGERPLRRVTWISGRFAMTDFFDNNQYSHDPRGQFMNWSLMSNGAWDYPADVRGYTVGSVAELTMKQWSLRGGVAMEPSVANGPDLDTRVAKNRGAIAEWEQRFAPLGHAGALRVLGYWNREHAGTFRDFLQIRRDGTKRYGFGLNLEQEITRNIGVFGRYGWSDGKTEAWAFTQIDRSLSGGASIQGRLWKRDRDRAGVAVVENRLSGDQRSFLAAGGLGFIVGDGRLNYRPESIIEAYYAWSATKQWTLSADYQRVTNPAYNHDRGPVDVWSLRVHWER